MIEQDLNNLKLENQLCFPIYVLVRDIVNEYRPLLNDLDLTYPQYLVLLVLWEKDDMKGGNLRNWIKTNEDLLIEHDSEIIYTGMSKFYSDIDTHIELEKQDLLEDGITAEEIKLRFQSSYEKGEAILKGLFKNIPIEKRSSLYLEMLFKIRDKFYQVQSDYLDYKVDLLLGEDSVLDNHKPIKNNYPRIFANEKAYEFFEKLRVEFESREHTQANFSFVFHRMRKDGLIFDHLKQLEFLDFLSELNINIDRIIPKSQMGNKDFRESIYNQIKLT